MNIFTVGHSNHPIYTFLGMLRNAGVTTLVDVRSKPVSRFSPQFNKASLADNLRSAGIEYVYRGDKLGGFGDPSPAMAAILHDFLKWREAHPDKQPALMCAEKSPFDCHRYYWLANWIKRSSNFTVTNIMPPGTENWEADLTNLPALDGMIGKDEVGAANLPVYDWRVDGQLRGFFTRNDATAYCIAKEINVGLIHKVRKRV